VDHSAALLVAALAGGYRLAALERLAGEQAVAVRRGAGLAAGEDRAQHREEDGGGAGGGPAAPAGSGKSVMKTLHL
jgi:hypothetical protein